MMFKSWLWLWGSALSVVLTLALWNLGGDRAAFTIDAAQMESANELVADESVPGEFGANGAENNDEILAAIAPSQVVYLAETHSDAADHAAQLSIIQALDAKGDIAIGLEMFQRPFQTVLDDYLAGNISEDELIAGSEYETRWGWDWAFYAPIVRYAKENSIPLIALNTPAEMTRKVATSGLESLEGDDFNYIPPVAEIDLSDADYRAQIAEVFNAHGGMGHSLSLDNFFAAQVLWDETMADRVAAQLTAQPDRQVIVLAGEGHVLNGYGIPNRVERRLPEVVQSSIQLVPDEAEGAVDAVDFVWVTDGE